MRLEKKTEASENSRGDESSEVALLFTSSPIIICKISMGFLLAKQLRLCRPIVRSAVQTKGNKNYFPSHHPSIWGTPVTRHHRLNYCLEYSPSSKDGGNLMRVYPYAVETSATNQITLQSRLPSQLRLKLHKIKIHYGFPPHYKRCR